MEKNFKLSATEIINKQFTASAKGYQALEVDEFLDLVIIDYTNFEKEFDLLAKKLSDLQKNHDNLKIKHAELEALNAILQAKVKNIGDDTQVSRANIDLLNRIKALENALYKVGENPTKIK